LRTLDYFAILVLITAAFAYLNHHLLRLPRSSGLLVIALAVSLALRATESLFPHFELAATLREALSRADLGSLLLNGFLGFLLFAGAIGVNVRELLTRKWTILALATIGVVLSTVMIAAGMYYAFHIAGFDVPAVYCLVFGALLSPTDPVTVLRVLDREGVPRRLHAIIAGESLFNDGVGIVLFTMFLAQAGSDSASDFTVGEMLLDFVREGGGGAVLGLATGGMAFVVMRSIDEYNIELLISLALVAGTYALAQHLGVSGPVAVVIAGLLMGSVGARYAVSDRTRDYLRRFWSVVDELLNSMLFLLIGLEIALIDLRTPYLVAAALAIPLALGVRAASSLAASLPLNLEARHKARGVTLLTWSGLRGGISIALALSLPASPYREALLTACYGVAVFTMLAQGLTLGWVASRLYPSHDP
jgi:CPA1 family monovalent cation:H+ antiporter